MFLLRPSFLLRFSSSFAALTMDAARVLPRHTFSPPSSVLTPLLAPQRFSYASFFSISRKFRNSRRLYASSSEPPFPLLHPHLVPKEQVAKPKVVKEDCITGSTATVPKPLNPETETSPGKAMDGCMPTLEQELLKEAATKEFQEASIVVSDDMPFKTTGPRLLGRQRKRKTFVPQAPKRLYSEQEDLGYMQEALVEARKAAKKGEVPVGAVLVHNNKIIARFHNQ